MLELLIEDERTKIRRVADESGRILSMKSDFHIFESGLYHTIVSEQEAGAEDKQNDS